MEEIYKFCDYLPRKTGDNILDEYIKFHQENLKKSFENKLFTGAYFHLHILYMIFIYIQIYRISKDKEQEFKYCWIGLANDEESYNKKTHPLSFSSIKEKTIFRFFRLIDFDKAFINEISDSVKDRNSMLHANGEIVIKNDEDFDKKLNLYLQKKSKIILKQKVLLEKIYLKNVGLLDCDYMVYYDDIELNFFISDYFSIQELKLLAVDKSDKVSTFINNNF